MAKREDSRLPVARSRQLLLLAAAFGLALALGGTTTVHAQEAEIVADCEGNSLAVETNCEFGDGQEFTVAVQLTAAPSAGYFGIQAWLRWADDVLDYRPTSDLSQEVVWPDCGVPARNIREVDTAVVFGCVPIPFEPSSYLGTIFLFSFVCIGQGTSPLTLVSLEEAGGNSSHLIDASAGTIGTSVAGASVTCGGDPVDRPESEVTVNPPPPLEDATPQPPDEATPGGPTVTPGGPTATPGATVIRTPTLRPDAVEDDDDDGGGLPVWAWTLIGLAIAAGVGGGGFVAWRRLRARGEGAEPDQPS